MTMMFRRRLRLSWSLLLLLIVTFASCVKLHLKCYKRWENWRPNESQMKFYAQETLTSSNICSTGYSTYFYSHLHHFSHTCIDFTTTQSITNHSWRSSCSQVAFLIWQVWPFKTSCNVVDRCVYSISTVLMMAWKNEVCVYSHSFTLLLSLSTTVDCSRCHFNCTTLYRTCRCCGIGTIQHFQSHGSVWNTRFWTSHSFIHDILPVPFAMLMNLIMPSLKFTIPPVWIFHPLQSIPMPTFPLWMDKNC